MFPLENQKAQAELRECWDRVMLAGTLMLPVQEEKLTSTPSSVATELLWRTEEFGSTNLTFFLGLVKLGEAKKMRPFRTRDLVTGRLG